MGNGRKRKGSAITLGVAGTADRKEAVKGVALDDVEVGAIADAVNVVGDAVGELVDGAVDARDGAVREGVEELSLGGGHEGDGDGGVLHFGESVCMYVLDAT